MITCGSNFNHIVMQKRPLDHRLVTWGIYQYLRHPSYVGWFWWSIGTQLVLCNPICFVGYFYAAWTFFEDRIDVEEKVLMKSYGKEYVDYAKSSWIGIPFISSPAANMKVE